MKWSAALLAVVAVNITYVSATPVEVDAQVSPVMSCIRKSYPEFPKGSRPSDQVLHDCTNLSPSKAKRNDTELFTGMDELIYEPQVNDQVKTRGTIGDTIQVLVKTMALASKASCGSTLHNEFVWSKDIQKDAERICKGLMADINRTGISQTGAVGVIVDQLANGHNKRGHQLKDKVTLTATWMLNLYPLVNMANEEIKKIADGVYDLCDDAITRLTTEDVGCAETVKYYQPSKAKHYKDPAALDGSIRMSFNSGSNLLANLFLSFTNDE